MMSSETALCSVIPVTYSSAQCYCSRALVMEHVKTKEERREMGIFQKKENMRSGFPFSQHSFISHVRFGIESHLRGDMVNIEVTSDHCPFY